MNLADRHDWLVKAGAERYVATYMMLFARATEGGRVPGVVSPSKEELLQLYASTSEGYWQALASTDPNEAQSQLAQWSAVSK